MVKSEQSINPNLILTMAILSILIGGWGGLNQTQLRKIIAYSSIAHIGWMTAVLPYNTTITILNLLIYITTTLAIFILLIHSSATTTLSLSHTWNKIPIITSLIIVTLLSIGGLPPLSGFIPKWIIIQEITKNESIIMPTLIAITALLNLYFYIRLAYSSSLTMFPSTNNIKIKWQFEHTKQIKLLPTIIVLSTLILPITPALSSLN